MTPAYFLRSTNPGSGRRAKRIADKTIQDFIHPQNVIGNYSGPQISSDRIPPAKLARQIHKNELKHRAKLDFASRNMRLVCSCEHPSESTLLAEGVDKKFILLCRKRLGKGWVKKVRQISRISHREWFPIVIRT